MVQPTQSQPACRMSQAATEVFQLFYFQRFVEKLFLLKER